MIIIGEFEIENAANGKVWIRHVTGEGGEFSEKEFEEVIKDFYNENF